MSSFLNLLKKLGREICFYWVVLLLGSVAFYKVWTACEADLSLKKCPDPVKSTSTGSLSIVLEHIRTSSRSIIQSLLPSPHSELVLGMVLGIDNLDIVPRYKDVLVKTGTIHVVVVSGYNIVLVFEAVLKFVGSRYLLRNMLISQLVVCMYAILTGLEPPVLRALFMGSIVSWQQYLGEKTSGLRLIFSVGFGFLVYDPSFIKNLSFILSFTATVSLMLFNAQIETFIGRVVILKKLVPEVFLKDFSTSLAAQILVIPVIATNFERVSLFSPVVNALVLWVVPLITMGGTLILILGALNLALAKSISYFLYVPLDYFVQLTRWFSTFNFIELKTPFRLTTSLAYFIIVPCFLLIIQKIQKKKNG